MADLQSGTTTKTAFRTLTEPIAAASRCFRITSCRLSRSALASPGAMSGPKRLV